MERTQDLEAVLTAAKRLLEAHEDQMITRVEWDALAVAVDNVADRTVDSATYNGWLDVWNWDCIEAAELALDQSGVQFERRQSDDHIRFVVANITAAQYSAVIEALTLAGEPSVDWNFPLE